MLTLQRMLISEKHAVLECIGAALAANVLITSALTEMEIKILQVFFMTRSLELSTHTSGHSNFVG